MLTSLATLLITFAATFAFAQVERPPQYVLLAFDGSSSISMWKMTREFAKRATSQGAPLNFTYFISGVYYVGKANKGKYTEPTHGAGASAIGWGEGEDDLLARFDQTNLAAQEKNEIASHANAHFDGSKWSFQNWRDEFRQFHEIIFNFFAFNNLKSLSKLFPTGWVFGEKSMVGFRAPQLGVSPGLWDTLRDFGYRYDTSKTSRSTYWPQRDPKGFWNFPLAQLAIAGTGKRTLSMDYNFYFADSKALPDPANKERYKRQMLESYLQYFESNYNGNRAPIHIGHHFSLWNGGAYWEAMQEFALKVCSKPEVKCVTYREFADFMDSRTPEQLRAYEGGNFQKNVPIRLAQGVAPLDLDVRVAELRPGQVGNMASSAKFVVRLNGGERLNPGDQIEVRANGATVRLRPDRALDIDSVRRRYSGKSVEIETRVLRGGVEIARATQNLRAVGQSAEELETDLKEDRALLGDLPEAHLDETRE